MCPEVIEACASLGTNTPAQRTQEAFEILAPGFAFIIGVSIILFLILMIVSAIALMRD